MTSDPILDAAAVRELRRSSEPPVLLDIRWELGPGAQPGEYERGHLPEAAFVDLDRELAGPPGAGGRHPLPDIDTFSHAMRRAGVSGGRAVVVYDGGVAMAAARAWWLLRYFGQPQVYVLDGGLPAWVAAGGELETGDVHPPPGDFLAQPGQMPALDAERAGALAREGVLIDARAPERYRGEVEPIDPVAGHIPGAVNHPASTNLDDRGRLLSADRLREGFDTVGIADATAVGAYCGSGVSAALEVLALARAGYPAALYPGSWSEWIVDPGRPVARGGAHGWPNGRAAEG